MVQLDQTVKSGQTINTICAILWLSCLLAMFTGCAWTMSPDRSKRISNCLEQCNSQDGRSSAPDSNAAQGDWGTKDNRTPCERKCRAK